MDVWICGEISESNYNHHIHHQYQKALHSNVEIQNAMVEKLNRLFHYQLKFTIRTLAVKYI